jgi:hypothetical protein
MDKPEPQRNLIYYDSLASHAIAKKILSRFHAKSECL